MASRLWAAFVGGALVMAGAPLAFAQPALDWPVDCVAGKTCFIEDYFDADPTQGRQSDFACGINSRDGHRGTDIALLSFDALETGVAVVAAAPGRVVNIRDGMEDDRLMRGVTAQNACGNAVLLDHGEGWQTLYCHLRLGSVRVSQGQDIPSGTPLGLVGLSGQTNHPHLHLTVLHKGQAVDPFDPEPDGSCETASQGLWKTAPVYYGTGLVTAGFSDRVPSFEEVRTGAARIEDGHRTAPLVVYAFAAHAEHGDILQIEARAPDGLVIFRQRSLLRDPQVSTMRAYGKKAPSSGWKAGDYLGEVTLFRNDTVIAHRFAHLSIK